MIYKEGNPYGVNKTDNFDSSLNFQLKNTEIARFENLPSPIFTFKNDNALNTNGTLVFDFTTENKPYSAYAPFTNLKVINRSSQPIYIYFGEIGDNYDFVSPNYSVVYNKQDLGGGLSSLKIQNVGSGSINANEIIISVFKEGLTEKDVIQDTYSIFSKILPQKFSKWRVGINK